MQLVELPSSQTNIRSSLLPRYCPISVVSQSIKLWSVLVVGWEELDELQKNILLVIMRCPVTVTLAVMDDGAKFVEWSLSGRCGQQK